MKIVVVGGAGFMASRLITMLTEKGHEAVAAAGATLPAGLDGALRGAEVVVDVLNPPSFADSAAMLKFLKTSTHDLLALEAAAGVRHHVMLSAVGTGRLMHSGYFLARFAQEKLVKESSTPHSIVEATESFEFLTTIADAATHGSGIRVPPVLVRPLAAEDVARQLAKIATGTPSNGTVEIGGRELFRLDGLIQRVLGARNDPREVIADPRARYLGAALSEHSLLPGDEAELGAIRFADWLGPAAPAAAKQNSEPALGAASQPARAALAENEFRVGEVPPGSVLLLGDVAVFGVDGRFCATQAMCTHRQGSLSDGTLDGSTVTCPLHGAQFNVLTGAVLRGPARDPLKTYSVEIDGDVGRIDMPNSGGSQAHE